jgi:hypothetical protein
MDVVKTNIERTGGRAKIESAKGRGSTVRLEIPLTLATIPALTVVAGKSVFAIPQAALVDTWALTYGVNRKLLMDAGAAMGFNSGLGTPGNAAFVGITYAFGTLYRPHHFPAAGVQRVP